MTYQILNDEGTVINIINADESFVQAHYPGHYRDVTPEPPKQKEPIISKVAFFKRFTAAEYKAFKNLVKEDGDAERFFDAVMLANAVVDLNDVLMVDGMAYLTTSPVESPVLTEARKVEILTPEEV